MGSLQVSDVHILISSSSFGIHLCLIFLEYYNGAKYYLPVLYISSFMWEVITLNCRPFYPLETLWVLLPWILEVLFVPAALLS